MPTTTTHTDQIILSLRPDNTVRGINVFAVLSVLGDDGKPLSASALPPRDATPEEVTGILDPALVAQQAQVTDLTEQLAALKAATTEALGKAKAVIADPKVDDATTVQTIAGLIAETERPAVEKQREALAAEIAALEAKRDALPPTPEPAS